MDTFAIDRGPFFRAFDFFGECISRLWSLLDSYVLFQGVTLARLMLGFIALSALFGLFWKGVRG